MTDKVPPKPKRTSKIDGKVLPGPKLVSTDVKPAIGHNSNNGEKHPEVIKRIEELMAFQGQKKAIAKAERDVRNSLKTEFNILSSSIAREIAMRKLDPDVRVQVEVNYEDLKKMTGYQPSLDFSGSNPTDASVKAQPSEEKLTERNTEPTRVAINKPSTKGFLVADDDDDDNNDDADDSHVITREG